MKFPPGQVIFSASGLANAAGKGKHPSLNIPAGPKRSARPVVSRIAAPRVKYDAQRML
jgi:hypothetical protein